MHLPISTLTSTMPLFINKVLKSGFVFRDVNQSSPFLSLLVSQYRDGALKFDMPNND